MASVPGKAKKSLTSRVGVPNRRRPVEQRRPRAAEEPGAHDQVRGAVAVHVAERGAGPAAEVRVVDAEEVRPTACRARRP